MNLHANRLVRLVLCATSVLVGCGVTLYTPTELNVNKRTAASLVGIGFSARVDLLQIIQFSRARL